jgi:hypothetical protein
MNSVQTTAQEDNKWARWAEDTGEKFWTNRKFCRGLLRQSCWLTGGHHGGRRLFGGSCHTPWAGVTDTLLCQRAGRRRGTGGSRPALIHESGPRLCLLRTLEQYLQHTRLLRG